MTADDFSAAAQAPQSLLGAAVVTFFWSPTMYKPTNQPTNQPTKMAAASLPLLTIHVTGVAPAWLTSQGNQFLRQLRSMCSVYLGCRASWIESAAAADDVVGGGGVRRRQQEASALVASLSFRGRHWPDMEFALPPPEPQQRHEMLKLQLIRRMERQLLQPSLAMHTVADLSFCNSGNSSGKSCVDDAAIFRRAYWRIDLDRPSYEFQMLVGDALRRSTTLNNGLVEFRFVVFSPDSSSSSSSSSSSNTDRFATIQMWFFDRTAAADNSSGSSGSSGRTTTTTITMHELSRQVLLRRDAKTLNPDQDAASAVAYILTTLLVWMNE
jgi:hypothetical protein